jgi:uncharacterized surface protein with fasciclin (FAS1) repeats
LFGGVVKVGPSLESKDLRTVTAADNLASNGVVHIIDGVLLPPAALAVEKVPAVPQGKVLIQNTGVCQGAVTGQFLVDDGACYSLKAVKTSGVNYDQRISCDNGNSAFSTVTITSYYGSTNGKCSGAGYIGKAYVNQCISSRLSRGAVRASCPSRPAPKPSKKNIVELAESVKDLSTLVAAVVAGDLVDTLVSPGPFTVFAPTNEGFAALPAGVVDSLMKPENKASLVDILTYHVVAGKVLSTDLAAFQDVTTVEGKKVKVTKVGGVVKVQESRTVTKADNLASNGVVHIIDGVLLPASGTAMLV